MRRQWALITVMNLCLNSNIHAMIPTPTVELIEVEECAICLEALNSNAEVMLPCEHFFCRGCMKDWQKAQDKNFQLNLKLYPGSNLCKPKRVCPSCRREYEKLPPAPSCWAIFRAWLSRKKHTGYQYLP